MEIGGWNGAGAQRVFVRFNRLTVGRNVYGPDEMAMETDDGTTLYDVLMTIWNAKFLPEVKAFRVAWVTLHEGRPLALLARGLRSPILFTSGTAPIRDYTCRGCPVFFMADLGRQESRETLESFGRRVQEGGDEASAMNDVLESYLAINRRFGPTVKVSVRARGFTGDRHLTLHAEARLSDAVYCVYRSGCLPEPLPGGPAWMLGSPAGALAVLHRDWAQDAHALYLPDQDAKLAVLCGEEEKINLELVSAGNDDAQAVYERLKGKEPGGGPDWTGLGNGFNNRFKL